jgi:hypothetical protein
VRAASQGVDSIETLVQLPEARRAAIFSELSGSDYKHLVDVAKNWPKLELVSSSFKGADAFFAFDEYETYLPFLSSRWRTYGDAGLDRSASSEASHCLT